MIDSNIHVSTIMRNVERVRVLYYAPPPPQLRCPVAWGLEGPFPQHVLSSSVTVQLSWIHITYYVRNYGYT